MLLFPPPLRSVTLGSHSGPKEENNGPAEDEEETWLVVVGIRSASYGYDYDLPN